MKIPCINIETYFFFENTFYYIGNSLENNDPS